MIVSGNGPAVVPGGLPAQYLVDGAIAPSAGLAVLTKGSAGAYTLAAPEYDGQRLKIISATSFAHVVTATALVWDGTTGVNTTLTCSAFRGASCTLFGFGGLWQTEALVAVTPA